MENPNRIIKKVAVLGSGIMGSRIACHMANAGLEVELLDIVPFHKTNEEEKKGVQESDPVFRNRLVNDALQTAIQSNPSPLYLKNFADRIRTGNFEDHMDRIATCDWVIEVVVERLDIKKKIFEKVEQYRRAGTLISSNTSGIPIQMMLDGRSQDFKRHFCGTHFFNPPRYLPLLEIIPTSETAVEVVDFLLQFGQVKLGKKTVRCKDTPAFIANRIGVFSILQLFHAVKKTKLSVETIDKLTGPVLGRPKSATFRTCDVVGLDTLVHVANGLKENCPNDEAHALFTPPDYIQKMVENDWLGSKTNQGFYKKVKDDKGQSEILSLDLQSMEYKPQEKVKFATLESTKSIDDLKKRLPLLVSGKDEAGDLYRQIFGELFAYVSHRIPEISDELYRIDDAMRAGFGWELGPFEYWEAIGLEKGIELIQSTNKEPAGWVNELVKNGYKSFYTAENGKRRFYDIEKKSFTAIPIPDQQIDLDAFGEEAVVWKNADCRLIHLGDGILNLSFSTKMNTIGGGVIEGINQSIALAEKSYKGLVISNSGQNFSAGANVGMIFMMAIEQEWDELNYAVKTFQDTMMRLRYSDIPVVVAPHQMALGGGCEMSMHADAVVAHAELYMGLVEFGVGVIPGGGGTKEFAKRFSEELKEGDIRMNRFRERFLTIGQAKVSTSAHEAFELGYLRKGIDQIVMSRELQLATAKSLCQSLAEKGYTRPVKAKNITVLGQEALGIVYVGAHSMLSGNYISAHDQLISEKLGYVLAGGDLSEMTEVSENYLLELERKAFVQLCQQKKTLERMESLVKYGKILRN